MAVTRRVFVVGAAAACVACGGEDGSSPVPAEAGAPSTAEPVASTTTEGDGTSTTDANTDTADTADVAGFGVTVDLGPIDEVARSIEAGGGFHYVPEGRAWITRVDAGERADVEAAYGPLDEVGMAEGFVGLFQKCPHLGCRVPECVSSQRFECPCHGSVYNRIGERVSGPAPRGMDRFPIRAGGGRLVLDTSTVLEGRAPGTLTIPGDPAGPVCIGG